MRVIAVIHVCHIVVCVFCVGSISSRRSLYAHCDLIYEFFFLSLLPYNVILGLRLRTSVIPRCGSYCIVISVWILRWYWQALVVIPKIFYRVQFQANQCELIKLRKERDRLLDKSAGVLSVDAVLEQVRHERDDALKRYLTLCVSASFWRFILLRIKFLVAAHSWYSWVLWTSCLCLQERVKSELL